MKKQYKLLGLSLILVRLLSSCATPAPEPTSALEDIDKSYKKIETSASDEEIAELAKLGRLHLEDYVSRYRSAKDVSGAGYDVGIIPATDNCPIWSEKVVIHIDNENDNPATSTIGWVGAWTKESTGDSHMRFCKVDGRLFANMKGTFAVVKFGPNNPSPSSSGQHGFRGVNLVMMDNEDGGGTGISQGDAAPNYVDSYKNLRLHLSQFSWTGYPYPDVATPFPDFGFSYGVIGWPELSLAFGEYYTDDEDKNTKSDYINVEGNGTAMATSVQIMRNRHGSRTGTNFKLSKVR